MTLLSFYTKLYAPLHKYPGVPIWVLTPLRRIVRKAANKALPEYLAKTTTSNGRQEKDLIVSFTSFPGRISNVWQVVKCLKNQTILPEKIILWLSRDQFPKKDSIPEKLRNEEDGLFEIRMVDGDIRSHKKYYYAFQEFPEKSIITVDDDTYYSPDTICGLLDESKRSSGCIIANITSQLQYDSDGKLLPYVKWKCDTLSERANNREQIGVGGVLYPPHSLDALVLRQDLFMKLTPLADDIWLNCMARLHKTPVVQTPRVQYLLPILQDASSLNSVNIGCGQNDLQIQALRDYLVKEGYADVYDVNYKVNEVSVDR